MRETDAFYSKKSKAYFSASRTDILPLLPDKIDRVLEIGCGEGATLQWLKNNRHCKQVVGVELFPEAAEIARDRIDTVIIGNIETVELPYEHDVFDLILCLDVLEHLVDPWAVIRRLTALIKPGGSLIASIPNVKHHTVLLPLLFKGQWNYTKKGVLDKTHLRFFTRKTAIELVESSGMSADMIYTIGFERKTKSWIANILSLGILKVIFENQYVIRTVKK